MDQKIKRRKNSRLLTAISAMLILVLISSDGVLYVSHDLNAVTMTGYNGMYEYMNSDTIAGLTTKAGNKEVMG